MNVLDLFSGIGGFSLGLERAGMRTVAFCEQDEFCQSVLGKHWPDLPVAPDITRREFREGEADVITAGFPCQDISLAGEGAGLAGERSGLYREVVRAIRLVRPRFAVLENVAALLGRGLDTVLGDMAEIGVDAEWHCIPASAVGAPHRRDRIWIVADARGKQHEGNRAPLSGEIAAQLSGTAADAAPLHGAAQLGDEPDGDSQGARTMADAKGEREHGGGPRAEPTGRAEPTDGRWWSVEPDVGRVADGVSYRVDRLRALGNAVVPQIPEIIGRAIMNSIVTHPENDAGRPEKDAPDASIPVRPPAGSDRPASRLPQEQRLSEQVSRLETGPASVLR
ncbi:MAG: DNA cytosine methyltransferase [Myxococcales bacterium]|nr:MAG: DNA cytosine methyltransferase [Myxococcales bacterium]